MTLTYSIGDVAPFINWIYFYHAWGISSRPDAEKQKLRGEAEERLARCAAVYHTHAVFQLFNAYSEGDDIVLMDGDKESAGGTSMPGHQGMRIPLLRQQQEGSDYLCLADFIRPRRSVLVPPRPHSPVPSGETAPPETRLGIFATTVDMGLETDFDRDPYEKMMMQLLADRLAEATAEKMHCEVRRHYWGYAPDEQLSIGDMLVEHWQGIRPAVGYPSLPDTSMNFLIDQLIDMKQIGIRLTESGAMKPHASVSGLMMSHPQARYFAVGKIGADQLSDYARRRGLPVEVMRKFLAGNL